ncbi:MAG TPA: phosphatase PAP2 family protein [Vicinamibacterales bacterium]|nr:phosphatase PAP2 family protein [Vicinamibacterales bacterium]
MRPSVIVLVIVGLLSGATAAVAQTETPTVLPTGTGEPPPSAEAPPPATERRTGFRTLFRDLGSDIAHLPSRDSLVVGAIGGGAALALHSADSTFNQHLEGTSAFNAGNYLGNTGTIMGATFGVYGVSLLTGHPRVTHVALDLVRAQLVSELMVQSIKIAGRRDRPDGSSGYSFPSGHTAITFASAVVLQRHHGIKWALPAYGLAAYVAMSRLHDNVHYLSDVAFGAAVGTIAGRTITRHGANNFALMPMAVPGGAGIFVVRAN